MIGSSRNYAVGMAHFQIAGGWKSLAIACGAYIMLFCTGTALIYYAMRSSPTPPRSLGTGLANMLLAFEAFVLVVFASLRVASAITVDITSRMIESHRLMPVATWRAVTGYILGAGAHAIVFAALNGALAVGIASATGTTLETTLFNQAILLWFAMLVWTFAVFMSQLARKTHFALLVGFSMVAMVPAYMGLPGFSLLVGPLLGRTIFNARVVLPVHPLVYTASLAMQATFLGLFFLGACRLYRGTHAATYTAWQALLVLFAWCLSSGLGLALWNEYHMGLDSRRSPGETFGYVQLIASIAVAMLISIIPVRITTLRDPRTPTWATCLILSCSIAAITLMPLGLRDDPALSESRFGITLLVVAAHVVTMYAAFQVFRAIKATARALIIGAAVVTLWMVPVVTDLAISALQQNRSEDLGIIGTLSPLGLLISTWVGNERALSPVPGLMVQWLPAVMLLAVWSRNRRRNPATSAPPEDTLS